MQAIDIIRPANLAALALCLAGALAPAPAKAERAVVIVFDGSGSMWGGLEAEKINKLYAARDALRLLLQRIASGTRLGLASFGHRRKADCSDAEVMVRPDAGTLDQITAALGQLNPKGKGPEGSAVPNITPDRETGIGDWTEEQISDYLESGNRPDGDVAGGLMMEVIQGSSAGFKDLTKADRQAIAKYLKSIPPIKNKID